MPDVLGATGEVWTRFLGGATHASVAMIGALIAWAIAPLALGAGFLTRRDL